ncbi:MAG: polyphosphate kinase 1 [Deltaproteobacteria bacterium]|nr:polyphosphate kinase 1 [Deltaproteobacteria bacterium]MBW2446651.1 polyphosphate kinase 1 [Deltaproteobacteria bacterium]
MTPETRDAKPEASPLEVDSPELLLNRETTWLSFNARVLHEAKDERTPLLERVKFLAIVSSNLDEFFMKRIGGLKQQVGAGIRARTVDGRTPEEQIVECEEIVREMEASKAKEFSRLIGLLSKDGIELVRYAKLEESEQALIRDHYVDNIFPLVTPQAMDPAHPFPFVSNLSLNLLVMLHHPKDPTQSLARVKVPVGAGIPRFVRVGAGHRFVPLEEVMAANLDLLFPGMEIDGCELFRVTRNANTDREEDVADDLLSMIETELRERQFAPIVRLEVAKGMLPIHRGMLAAELGLDEESDVAEVDGMLGMGDLTEIAFLPVPDLHDAKHAPVDSPALASDRNIFHIVRDAGSVLLHHPYESFSGSVERFLREAADDVKVRAIKMTIYRTSDDSGIVEHLIRAARNGKQVAVVVELQARFDEDANIRFASRLEERGIHVTYGVVGLKTHCKVTLVVRQDYDGLRRYCHIGTGNYNADTARIYSDMGLLTADEEIGRDATELFNYLTTGYKPRRTYRKLLPAPTVLKQALLGKIEREIREHGASQSGHIQMKMNALEDADVTRALYRAAQAGVKVDLIVRDTCRLRPGLEGFSESVRVVSIVGRFLEHARVYYFANGGAPEYYIGSADCMKRNLESRVEVLAPVEAPEAQAELRAFLDAQLEDLRNGWDMQPDGTYVQREPQGTGRKSRGSHQGWIEWADRRQRDASRLRKRRPRGPAQRN